MAQSALSHSIAYLDIVFDSYGQQSHGACAAARSVAISEGPAAEDAALMVYSSRTGVSACNPVSVLRAL